MKASRAVALLVVLVVVAIGTWFVIGHRRAQTGASAGRLAVYYTTMDGRTLGHLSVSLRPQQAGESSAAHRRNLALYAAVEAVAGPPSDVQAIRFPPGTRVRSVRLDGTTAIVDLSREVANGGGGSFGENGEFKALVYTMTGLPFVHAVAITVDGQRLQTLPGGHLELDQPLHRRDW